MIQHKFILVAALTMLLIGCSTPKTSISYERLLNGHTKVIDHKKRTISYIDHTGRVYKKVCIDYEE